MYLTQSVLTTGTVAVAVSGFAFRHPCVRLQPAVPDGAMLYMFARVCALFGSGMSCAAASAAASTAVLQLALRDVHAADVDHEPGHREQGDQASDDHEQRLAVFAPCLPA